LVQFAEYSPVAAHTPLTQASLAAFYLIELCGQLVEVRILRAYPGALNYQFRNELCQSDLTV